MNKRLFANGLRIAQALGVSAALVGVIGAIKVSALERPAAMNRSPQGQAKAAPAAGVIEGAYTGPVALKLTLGGVYSDSLATPAPPPSGAQADVGQIDLSLLLSQSGDAVSGYVALDKTLVFTAEHTIQATPLAVTPAAGQPTPAPAALKVGPAVQGSFDGTTLSLQSERTSAVVAGRAVQRQFRITGALQPGNPNAIVGEYRETLWGYASVPFTVIGQFRIARPSFVLNAQGAGNAGPLAVADTASTAQGATVILSVLSNDTDANGDALTITSVSKPQHGVASTNGSTISYTPNSTFVGFDTFSYFVSDGKGGTAVGSVTIAVGNVSLRTLYLPLVRR